MSIEIYEKRPITVKDEYYGTCQMYPVMMRKDGKEHLVIHRRDPQPEPANNLLKNVLRLLEKSDGRYTKIYGPQDTAFETIQEMIMNHRLFYTKGNLFYPEPEHGFIDFRGTIEEEFTIFWYRIFNEEDYLKLKEVVALMQNDKYDEAELKFCQLGL